MYVYRSVSIIVATLVCISGTPAVYAQVVTTPTVPQPTAGQLVGANFQNPTGQTIAAGPVQFGQAFASGDLAGGSGISATVNGASAPAQIDVKTSHGNGSVKFGVVTVMAPSLSANTTNPTMLAAAANSGSDISLSTLPGYSFVITMAISGSTTLTFNVANLFAQELAASRVSYWRRGPVVTEGRISIPITGSMRLVVDLSKYQNGSYSTDVQFNNDGAMQAQGGQIDYSVTIVQNGQTVATHSNLQHQQYQQWRQIFWTSTAPAVNVQRDVAYLKEVGVVHQYDLGVGVSTSLINTMASQISSNSNWGKPFDGAGITKYMPGTGARPDIGPATAWNSAWVKSQHATAATYALGQAQAAAGIPWHFWDVGNATWLNTTNYPNMWIDYRGGTGIPGNSNSTGLTQPVVASLYNWEPDVAHIPALSYIPYLFTGTRFYLDQLNAAATYVELAFWPSGPEYGNARNYGEGLVLTPANQIRGGAWAFRELVSAAWANPDGTPEKTYFTNMVQNNLNYVNGQRSTRMSSQGDIYGYNIGSYGSSEALPPWQQDYLMTSMALASQLGFSGADTYIEWATNWSAGRFLNAANGFNPRDGVNYLMIIQPGGQPLARTWAKLAEYTAGRTNGSGWAQTEGDYGQLGLAGLASIINRTGSPQAIDAYAILRGLNPPYTATSTYQNEPTFNIVPSVAVAAPPSSPTPTATLGAGSLTITAGQSTVLTWSSTNATTCTGTNFTAGSTSGTRTVSPTVTTTYSVSCAGAGGSASASVVVTVTPPSSPTPTATLGAAAQSVTVGQSTILTWSSTNATTCTGTNFTAGATSGTRTVSPTATTTYSVSCTGAAGSASASVVVRVAAVLTASTTTPPEVPPTSSGGGGGGGGNSGGSNSRTTSVSSVTNSTVSADGAKINSGSASSLMTKDGSWQISTKKDTRGYEILRNGKVVSGNGAVTLLVRGTRLYAINDKDVVTVWSKSKFTAVSRVTGQKVIAQAKSKSTSTTPSGGSTASGAEAPAAVNTIMTTGSRIKTAANVNVRATPSLTGVLKGVQLQGAAGTVLAGPVAASGYTWFQVDFDNSPIDGFSVGSYLASLDSTQARTSTPAFSNPSISSRIVVGSKVRTNTAVNVRSSASINSVLQGRQGQGITGTVVAGPVTAGGYIWYLIDYNNSFIDGWSAANFLTVVSVSSGTNQPLVLGDSTSTAYSTSNAKTTTIIGVTPLQKFINPNFITEFLSVGATGESVTRLQVALRSMGYLTAAVTGYYGTQTEMAVQQFQKSRNLQVTGTVTPETQDALNWH